MKKHQLKKANWSPALYARVRQILEAARTGLTRTVNTTQVVANWLIGREILEEEQRGRQRAEYGKELIRDLAQRLTQEFGKGYSQDNLFWFRRFYRDYPEFLSGTIFDAVRQISKPPAIFDAVRQISDAPCRKSGKIPHAVRAELAIRHTPCGESWQPGQLHSNLAWTHYRTLLRVQKPEARSFYEIEATQNNWAARELERQVNSLLYAAIISTLTSCSTTSS